MIKARLRKDNARDKEQLQRMEQLAKSIGCFFCKENYLKVGASPAIKKYKYWYIKKNDYPYKGSIHHYLIVSNRHVTKINKISLKAWVELFKILDKLKYKLKTRGESIFVRSGDMSYTGATLDHLHFHFLSGAPKKRGSKLRDNILVTLGHKSSPRSRS